MCYDGPLLMLFAQMEDTLLSEPELPDLCCVQPLRATLKLVDRYGVVVGENGIV